MKSRKPRRVEVRWLDSCSIRLGWDGMEPYLRIARPDRVRSVGWIVAEGPEGILLALNIARPRDSAGTRPGRSISDAIVIPRPAILRIRKL